MAFRVRFFGATAEIVGKPEIAILAEEATVATILERLLVDHPALASLNLRFAFNQEFVTLDSHIGGGGELAVFTPVSGG